MPTTLSFTPLHLQRSSWNTSPRFIAFSSPIIFLHHYTMTESRNIVVLGASSAGLMTTHYIMKHILPALKKKGDGKYHVYLINPTSDWWFRVASPRVAASTTQMTAESILFDIREEALAQYSSEDITFIQAAATGLDESARTVAYRTGDKSAEQSLPYHALIVATGSSTYHPAFSMSTDTQKTLDSIKYTNEKVASAKEIVIVGGGPTAVEFAGETGEFLNGKPGWFSKPEPKVKITVVTAGDHLLPALRPAIGQTAEQKLAQLGVKVVYKQRVVDTTETKDGRFVVELSNGEKLEADLYIPAYGVEPNSSFLPAHLLDEKKYLKTNAETLRVDGAGPRVYSIGDVASYSRNTVPDILDSFPALVVNFKRDLLSYNTELPNQRAKGVDRIYKKSTKEMQFVPIGSGGGVGALMGWRVPSWLVWMVKGRDYMLGMSGLPTAKGDKMNKEVVWSAEEAAI
jgi:NADH dehydrogenase FAD-containing subunit